MEGGDRLGMRTQTGKELEEETILRLAHKMKYGFVESFSGPGGISLGVEAAGLELLFAFDADEKAVETHCENLGNRCILADACDLDGKEILKKSGLSKGELPLFTGGPPCQGFSKQRRGAHYGDGDERNDLVVEFARLAREIEPRFFLFENVAIFGQKRGEEYLERMRWDLKQYELYPRFYNCADYGVAQTRERFVIVGRRKDQKVTFEIPEPCVTKWATVRDAIGGMPEPPEDYSDHPDFPNHQRARVTAINIKRFSFVPPGGGWQDIPDEYRLDCHKGADPRSGGWPDVYGRLEWTKPCPTITGGFDSFTRGRYGHPEQDRPITLREAARLQGFPDGFVFRGTRGDIRSQIGNAVPPALAGAIARQIMRSLLCVDGLLEDNGVDGNEGLQLSFFGA